MRDKTVNALLAASRDVRDAINQIIIDACRMAEIPIPLLFNETIKSHGRAGGVSFARKLAARKLREHIAQHPSGLWTVRELGEPPLSYPNIANILRMRDHVSIMLMCKADAKVTA